jgi:hypothetical protein
MNKRKYQEKKKNSSSGPPPPLWSSLYSKAMDLITESSDLILFFTFHLPFFALFFPLMND